MRTKSVRCPTWLPIHWPMAYGNGNFTAKGTALDITSHYWRVTGSMPVLPGTRLRLRVSPPEKADCLEVRAAIVLWIDRCEFMVKIEDISSGDRGWLERRLHRAESQDHLASAA